MRRSLVVAAVLVLVAAALAGCSSGGRDELVVYSGRTKNLVGPLLERFSDESGIAIGVRYGDSADLALLLEEEGANTDADVFLSQSPGAVSYVDEHQDLRPLDAALLDRVPASYRDPEGTWAGVTARVRVLVYNTDLVDEADLPRSVLDLRDERYAGRVAVAPTNGSFQDFVTAMRQRVGDDEALAWLRSLAENDARVYANNTAIVQAVGRGEVPMGLVNHYYNEQARAADPDVPTENWFFPDGDIGSLVIVSAVGVLAGTDKTEEAEALVTFLLSPEAQRYFADETFEYPLVQGVEPAGGLVPLSEIEAPEEDLSTLGGGLARTRELIEQSGLERG